MRKILLVVTMLSGLLGAFAAHAAPADVGVILMHGKWARSPAAMRTLIRELELKGFRVATPMMPWSDNRLYDAAYPAALAEIEAQANALRAKGAKKILVGGHSIGANAAIAYAASGREVDGVLALAPGHVPDGQVFRRELAASVSKARQMIAQGRAAEADYFDDINQGKPRNVRTTAGNYFSYFDPEGMGAMPLNAAKFPRAIPLLWVIGTRDGMYRQGEDYVFNRVPRHAASKYVVVDSDHRLTPTEATTQIVEWVLALGY